MKMTRRNFLSTSAVAALACGASLTAHAAGSTDENSLNFITDITFPSLFGSTVAMAKRRILSQRLLILAVAPLQAAFPSLILLVVSFELLRKRELHAMKPYTVIISQPLVAPKYLYSLHQQ